MSLFKKTIRILPIIIALILMPALMVFLYKCGKNEYKSLPYIGLPEGINAQGDTLYHRVPDFSFTDQYGQPYGTAQLKGKIWVADFIFTRCPSSCPYLTQNLKKLQEDSKDAKGLKIVSFSVDPNYDTPPVLASYAKKNDIDSAHWRLLTGVKDSIYGLMGTKGFLVVKPQPSDTLKKFMHSEVIDLIDREGHIRGSYNGTDPREIEKLEEDIRTLYVLYSRGKK